MRRVHVLATAIVSLGLAAARRTRQARSRPRRDLRETSRLHVAIRIKRTPCRRTLQYLGRWQGGVLPLLCCLPWDGWSKHGCPLCGSHLATDSVVTSKDVQSYTDGQLKWILDNGISPSGMPGSKGTLSDDELWSIIVYLRRLPPAGSQGTPDMYNH
jgi:hypothetical protein